MRGGGGDQPAGGGSRSPSQSPTATAPPEGEPLVQVQRRENVLAVLIPLGARRGEPFLRPEGEPFLRPEGAAKELSNRLLHPSHTPKFPFYAILERNGYS